MDGFTIGFKKTAKDHQEKMASVNSRKVLQGLQMFLGASAAATIASAGFKSLYNKISNSIRHKAILDDLLVNDPIIKQADPEEMKQLYATIFSLAPKLALEKAAVKEIMQNYARFGRLDMQTVKLLVDSNAKMQDGGPDLTSSVNMASKLVGSMLHSS